MKSALDVEALRRGFMKRIDQLVDQKGGRLARECVRYRVGSAWDPLGIPKGSAAQNGDPPHLDPIFCGGSSG